jgi:hypothetical protein
MAFQVAQKVLAEVYRLHHIPLPPITLETLIQRGPRVTSELISKIQQDPETLQKVATI